MSTKRNNFSAALKNISFYDNSKWKDKTKRFVSIRVACNYLEAAVEGWKKDKTHPQKSKSAQYLDPVDYACKKLHEICSQINAKTSVPTFTQYENLIKASKKLQSALKQASNAKFGIFTFGAVLDSKPVKKELARLAKEVGEFNNELKKDQKANRQSARSDQPAPTSSTSDRSPGSSPAPADRLDKALKGIYNDGTNYWCYMTSAIQTLYHNKKLRTDVITRASALSIIPTARLQDPQKQLIALSELFKYLAPSPRYDLNKNQIKQHMKTLGHKLGNQENTTETLTRLKELCTNFTATRTGLHDLGIQLQDLSIHPLDKSTDSVRKLISDTVQNCHASNGFWTQLVKNQLIVTVHPPSLTATYSAFEETLNLKNIKNLHICKDIANIDVFNNEHQVNLETQTGELVAIIMRGPRESDPTMGHNYVFVKSGGRWAKKDDNQTSYTVKDDQLKDKRLDLNTIKWYMNRYTHQVMSFAYKFKI